MAVELTIYPITKTSAPSVAGKVLGAVPLGLAVGIVVVAVLAAIFAPFIVPHSPVENSLVNSLKPPFWMTGGTLDFPLGTDRLGRDVLSRIIFGLRVSLVVSLLGGLLLGLVGATLGILSAYLGGGVDSIVQRVGEVSLALPGILIALVLAMTRGAGLGNVLIVILIIYWARITFPIRGEVLSFKERGFVKLARVANASAFYIMRRHLLPHVRDTTILLLSLTMGHLILTEASLSFLGAGVPPPEPSLGGMISEGLGVLERGWWISVFPGLVMTLIVLAMNMLGDWLRDRWDPRLQNL